MRMEGRLLIKLAKNDDLSSWTNYRGIILQFVPGKLFSRVLLNRMKDAVDPSFRTSRPAFGGAGPAQAKLQHCASSSKSHVDGTPLSMPALLTMRSHLTFWTDRASGNS